MEPCTGFETWDVLYVHWYSGSLNGGEAAQLADLAAAKALACAEAVHPGPGPSLSAMSEKDVLHAIGCLVR